MNCQILNFKKKAVKPVKVVKYYINAANSNALSMMQYVHYTVCAIFTINVLWFVNKQYA